MSFNLDFANNTFRSSSFSFFLVIDLYFLIPVAIAQALISTAELIIPIGITIKEAKAEIVDTKIRTCSI